MNRQSGKARPKTSRLSSSRSKTGRKLSVTERVRSSRRKMAGLGGTMRDRLGIGEVGVAASYSTPRISRMPKISRTAKSCRIAHRELINASVAGATTFTVQSAFALNPGLAATFPWLAPQALQWEQYCCRYLCFEWVPIAATSSKGDVILSPDYDASDPTPTTEVQASDNVGTIADSCWKRIDCTLDVEAMMALGPRKYVRPSLVAGDPKTFDVGKFFLAVNNEADTSAIGKLYVSYDFEFFVPQNSPNPNTTPQQTSLYTKAASQTFTTATPAPLQFDASVFDPIGFGAAAAGVFTPPSGVYRVEFAASFSNATSESTSYDVQIMKNGAALASPMRNIFNSSGIGAGADAIVTVLGVVPCNGTDTVQIQVLLTGATGPLTLVAARSQMLISLA